MFFLLKTKYVRVLMLSILLPVYNCEKYVHETIQSILDQSYTAFELLVADDGSTDESRKIIERFSDARIKVFHNDSNLGKTATVNKLFAKAQGDLVTIHDADDYSDSKRFEFQVAAFEKNEKLILCGTDFITITEEGDELEKSRLLIHNDDLLKGLSENSQFHGPTCMFKRVVAETIAPLYRPFFKDYNEDYDFCFRMAEKGEVSNVPHHLYYYRITQGSLSRTLTVQKKCSIRLVQFLAKQRRVTGTDDLIQHKEQQLNQLIHSFSEMYRRDPSLLLREQAELDFYYRFKRKALKSAMLAIAKGPFVLSNYRLLQYILRKSLVGI